MIKISSVGTGKHEIAGKWYKEAQAPGQAPVAPVNTNVGDMRGVLRDPC